jgi:hypothetical protein
MARTVFSTTRVPDAPLPAFEKWKSEETRKMGSDEGSNWPKMDQNLPKSTKTAKRVPQKQAKLEDPLEIEVGRKSGRARS